MMGVKDRKLGITGRNGFRCPGARRVWIADKRLE